MGELRKRTGLFNLNEEELETKPLVLSLISVLSSLCKCGHDRCVDGFVVLLCRICLGFARVNRKLHAQQRIRDPLKFSISGRH